jgi:Type II CAAX prenyl endopeptidase Rce1-like
MNRVCLILAVMGLTGVSSLGLAPLEALIPVEAKFTVPRFVLLIQPMVLVLGATALGCWAAPKLALGAPILQALVSKLPVKGHVRPVVEPAIVAGVIVALVLLAYGALTRSTFANASDPNLKRLLAFQVPLASKLLYGGIAEELLARWGVMSGVALAAFKLGFEPKRALWTGVVMAAVIFGIGHLPMLYAITPSPPLWLIGTVILGNMVPGIIFGLLFWRRGIESAMIGHATGHFLATSAAGL